MSFFPGYNFILGSASPRRAELLNQLGIDFEQVSINADESFSNKMDPFEVAEYLANKKSQGFRPLNQYEVLITADTVVINNGVILNKPEDEIEAFEMLKSLSAGSHFVVSGVCIRDENINDSFSVKTEVSFLELTDEQINYYISNYNPMDKAGAYGIQDWIGQVGVANVKGSYYNVVGLPTAELFKRLRIKYAKDG